ncbi:hypothetical protein K7432_016355 [Basidiobolus ranarum]|uniref:Uncharacterized protein n=1 Tax=Basidiobolus ranarum TaxID=34480 RepID=A0ABR2WEV1_9FUNG
MFYGVAVFSCIGEDTMATVPYIKQVYRSLNIHNYLPLLDYTNKSDMEELYINLQASTGYIQASLGCVLGNNELTNEGEFIAKRSHQNYRQLQPSQRLKTITPCAPRRQLYLDSKAPVPTAAV